MTPSPKHIDLAKGITQWNIDRYGVDVEGLRDGIALALAQAESDALERAAKECKAYREAWSAARRSADGAAVAFLDGAFTAADDIADRIRKLKAQP